MKITSILQIFWPFGGLGSADEATTTIVERFSLEGTDDCPSNIIGTKSASMSLVGAENSHLSLAGADNAQDSLIGTDHARLVLDGGS